MVGQFPPLTVPAGLAQRLMLSTENSASLSPHDGTRLRAVIEALPIAVVVVDRSGTIILANLAAAQMFGYAEAEMLGTGVNILVPRPLRGMHHLQIQSFFDAPRPRTLGLGRMVQAVNRQGTEFPVEIALTPVFTAEGLLAVAAIRDVTERFRVEAEESLAQVVQRAMLPQSQPHFDGCDICGISKPAAATGGDFFDFLPLARNRLGIVIGDASGHGFGAALVTASTRSYLRALSRTDQSPAHIVETTNKLLHKDLPDGQFVTLFYAVLDIRRLELTYAGAGHSAWLCQRDGTLKTVLDSCGPALGWLPSAQFPARTLAVEAGDMLVLTTDGIEESMNGQQELFGRQRVLQVVHEHAASSANEICQAVYTAVRHFRVEHIDDSTVIVVKF